MDTLTRTDPTTWRRSSAERFALAYPRYATTSFIDELRATEYSYLERDGHVYLDYTGAGLPSFAQLRTHVGRIRGGCFGNPHTDSPTSRASTGLVERARTVVLEFFRGSPTEYAVIFTSNASAACRLVGEAYPFGSGSAFVLTLDNHNSVNGIREFARAAAAPIGIVPLTEPDLRADRTALRLQLAGRTRPSWRIGRHRAEGAGQRRGLFAFPAQSNFTGVQHPLDVVDLAQRQGYDVLLDAAAFVPTNRLDLKRVHPDFVPVSFYKMFGYPTGVGCLLARREALSRLRRPWFSGGTIQAVSAQGDWHLLAPDQAAFEDGTLNFLSIPDVEVGIRWLDGVADLVHQRVTWLTAWLLRRLGELRHRDGRPVVQVYGPTDMDGRGATVAFNFLDPDGRIVDERVVGRDAAARRISLRTGCFCNPGAGEAAFAISKSVLTGSVGRDPHTIDEYLTLLGLPSAGAIRVSLGIASNLADVELFLEFAAETYRDRYPDMRGLVPRDRC